MPLILFLLGMMIVRFFLLGKGALSITDEWRYDESLRLLSFMAKQDWQNALATICNTQGRPADVMIRMIDAFLQTVFYKITGKEIYHPISLLIPSSINVLVCTLISIVFYKIAYIFLQRQINQALYATIVYNLLSNNSIYIRHILPYDYSLLCLLIALYLLLQSKQQTRFLLFSGIFSAFSFALYPGYYVGVVVLGVGLLFILQKQSIASAARQLFSFGAGFCMILLFFEAIFQLADQSYFLHLHKLSDSIIQGSFDEGFSFIIKYLLQNDYVVGGGLLLGNIIYILKVVRQWIVKRTFTFTLKESIFLAVLFGFLFHASSAFFFHKMVFYGRLIHFYLPFIVLITFVLLSEINLYNIGATLLISTACISYVYFFYHFYTLNYPRDAAYSQGLVVKFGDPLLTSSENLEHEIAYESGQVTWQPISIATTRQGLFTLVNFAYFYPLHTQSVKYEVREKQQLIYQALHFQFFMPYMFEGFSPKEREWARRYPKYLKIYHTP
jgi:hypothetical protein